MTDFFANLDYTVYLLALMTGFFGSGHCAGMCGALVAGFFMKTEKKSVWPYIAYHFSRITMYFTVGIIAALLGVALVSTGILGQIQGFLQVGIGFFVIILALGILGISPWQFSMKYMPTKVLNKIFMSAARRGSVLGASMGGMLNGLMPCPLTFAMAVNATTAPSPVEGGLMMLALGVGTLPTMFLVTFAFGKLGTGARGLMLKVAAVLMIVMGANTMYNGIRFLASDTGFKEMMHHMQSMEMLSNEPEKEGSMQMDHSIHNMVLSHKVHFSALPAIMSHNSNKIRFICLVLNGVILKNKSFS